jgi:hypothetical protein
MAEVAQIFGLFFFYSTAKFDRKIGWATFWVTSSQTHPVTLYIPERTAVIAFGSHNSRKMQWSSFASCAILIGNAISIQARVARFFLGPNRPKRGKIYQMTTIWSKGPLN